MNVLFAVGGIGGWEVILILAVVLIMFGTKKLPELARGLGQGLKEFKKATTDVSRHMPEPHSARLAGRFTASCRAQGLVFRPTSF